MSNQITTNNVGAKIREHAISLSRNCSHDGRPSIAYQVGYLGGIINDILTYLPPAKLKEYNSKIDRWIAEDQLNNLL
jgi:hypothetical protein